MSATLDIPQDKVVVVETIVKTTDLYKILYVKRTAKTADVIKQYKKLSILVHPDRNDHPKASDAFKKLGEAKRILSDETAKLRYDQTGSTSDRPPQARYHYADPEDIFSAFFQQAQGHQYARQRFYTNSGRGGFGGGDPFGPGFNFFEFTPNSGAGTRRSSRSHPDPVPSFWPIMLFLFFILISVTWMMSSTPTVTPQQFSFWKTPTHTVKHHTKDGIAYWLEPGKYDSQSLLSEQSRAERDQNVLTTWLQFKRHECSNDLAQSRHLQGRPQSCLDLDRMSGRR